MKDNWLADIFYTLVHDFDENIKIEARAELMLEGKSHYLKQIKRIRRWAKKNDYETIRYRANLLIKKIEKKR